jgi:hypothetical protein
VAQGERSTRENAIPHRLRSAAFLTCRRSQREFAGSPAGREFYFSTRMNWPVDASTDTVSFESSRFAPKMTCQIS